jgi:hypothetical protein
MEQTCNPQAVQVRISSNAAALETCNHPPATSEVADGSETESFFELNYARGGGSSGGMVRDAGMTIVAAAIRSGNALASSATLAEMVMKPLAQGAITRHALAADSWSHESGDVGSVATPSGMCMALMSTAGAAAIAIAIP